LATKCPLQSATLRHHLESHHPNLEHWFRSDSNHEHGKSNREIERIVCSLVSDDQLVAGNTKS
jgi:hypothetical protein